MSLIRIYDADKKLIDALEMSNVPRVGERLSFSSDKGGEWGNYSGVVVDVHYNFIGYMKGIEITIE